MDLFVQCVIKRKLFRQPIQIGEIENIGGTEYVLVKYVDFVLKGNVLAVRGIFQLASAKVEKFGSHQNFEQYVYTQGKYTKFDNGLLNAGEKIGGLDVVGDEYYRIDELLKIELRGTDIYVEYAVTKLELMQTGVTQKDVKKYRAEKLGLSLVK